MDLPDRNIFMMCKALDASALRKLPAGFHFRHCRRDELDIWKRMPFDNAKEVQENIEYMHTFYKQVYLPREQEFYQRALFVCNSQDQPVATGFTWKAYGLFDTVHWLKTLKKYEGLGIGRALLSEILGKLSEQNYPVYLHTQPGSFRAIKLYSDFGFCLLTDDQVGKRKNELSEGLPMLQKHMPKKDFQNLRQCRAPAVFISKLAAFDTIEF